MAQAQFTLTGITGLSNLVFFRVPPGARRLFTSSAQGNVEVTEFSSLGYPIAVSTGVKPFRIGLQTVITSSELALFRQYQYEQDSNGERGNLRIRNEAFRINEDQLALGNRTQVGSALAKDGINTYFYESYVLMLVPGDYYEPLSGDYFVLTCDFLELWN
jgi:hypothetical protein